MKKIYLFLVMAFFAFIANAQTTVVLNATLSGKVTSAEVKSNGDLTNICSSCDRGYLKFDLTSLPAGAVISAASLKIVAISPTASSTSTVNKITSTTVDAATAGAGFYATLTTATTVNTGTSWGGTVPITLNLPFTAAAYTPLQTAIATGQITYGVIRGSTNVYLFAGFANATTANQPQLTITYTVPAACAGAPAAGTATSTTASACSGQPFTLNLTGGSTSSGLTYQWQSSPASAGTFTNLGTSQSSSSYIVSSQTAATDYRVITTCTASGLSATSSIVAVTQNSFLNCYCITSPTTGGTGDIITNVTMGTLNNTTTYVAPAYFTSYNNTAVDLGQSTTQNISITFGTDANQHSAVWIDFNQNGIYEASENVALSTVAAGGSATVSYTLAIPLTATLGQTRMRVRGGSDGVYTAAGACTASTYGETEDYLVNIIPPPACVAPTAPVNTAITSTTASHSWTAASPVPAVGYEWIVTTSATPPASGTATTGTTATSTGLIANTTYYLHVRSNCGSGSFSTWTTSALFFTGYCVFSSGSATSYVDAFSTTGGTTNISNTASGFSATGYGDFTAQKVTQVAGTAVNFSITGVPAAAGNNGYAIYADYNNDLTFSAGERVYTSNAYALTPLSSSFTIPLAQPVGTYRMRVVTDFNLTNPVACGAVTRGEAEDYLLEVTAAPPCVGPINAGTATSSVTFSCTGSNTILNVTGSSSGAGLTYQWQSSPAGANTFTNITGATTIPYTAAFTASTDYQLVITCANGPATGTSTIATVTLGGVPSNDVVCSAIALVLDGATDCGNTTCATSVGDPTFSQSGANNTVWYTYTPATTGVINVVFTRPAGVTTGLLNGWLGIYTTTGTCPGALTFTEVTPATAGYNLTSLTTVTVTTPSLTAGTPYYFMIDGASGAFGAYCIKLVTPPLPPLCTTNITPADLATNVTTIPNVTFTWNAAATATSYDLYVGTTAAGATLISNYTTTTANVVGFSASTTYFWYVIPKNTGGAATGCNTSSATSFITSAVCNPSTGTVSGDGLTDFVLKGESPTTISILASTPAAIPGYTDLSASTTVDLAAGKAYIGNFKVQDVNDHLTIWIDFNNNGGFETTERVLNNLKPLAANATRAYSIMIPAAATPGIRKMRVRDVYYSSTPTLPTDPCSNYTYGESKDFTVNILASGTGSAYTVSSLGSGACTAIAPTTIDVPSNNNNVRVPLLDVTGAIVAEVNANSNILGTVTSSVYINTVAVRADGNNVKYLDRNIAITTATQPTGTVTVRLYYTAAELAALIAADPSVTATSLNCTKVNGGCTPTVIGSLTGGVLLLQAANGTLGSDYYADVNVTSFSNFFLHGGTVILPVSIQYFRGSKVNAAHILDWKVSCTSAASVQLTLERTADGRSFVAINNQTETATRCLQGFNYTDNSPLAGYNYYRLKTTSPDGKVSYSTIVVLLNKEKGFELISLAPNPVRNTATLSLTTVKGGKIDINVSDIAGKVISTQSVIVIAGNNPINMNFTALGAGTYIITAVNTEGELKTTRFVKF